MMSGFITCGTEQERNRERKYLYRLGSKELKDSTGPTRSSELVHFRLPLKIVYVSVCVCVFSCLCSFWDF